MEIKFFEYTKEEGQNPYIGFMSFQHFRGEALYSDIVVKPEKAMTETEDIECYPIPQNVPQNGRKEGIYPDTSVAYIRILWKEFEPRRGEYHYEVIEDILQKAKKCEQTVMFRLMPHSTRACDDVPDWLKEMIPCPERPDGERVKDSPTDPLFLEYFGEAIRKIGERFDDNPILDTVDICLPGAWGEGHNLHLYSEESLRKLVDIYTEVFKKTCLIGQVASPWIVNYANETKPVGWRGDGTGEPGHLHVYFPEAVKQMPEVWKKAPVSFEAYWWLGEWQRKGWDIDEIIELTLGWHLSTFNAKSLPIPNEWKEKIEYWNSKMGYHFTIDYFKYPGSGSATDVLKFELGIDNLGVAPIYHYIPVKIRLINDEMTYVFDTDIDIRNWMPGKCVNSFVISSPNNVTKGIYEIEIGIFNQEISMIYFCTNAVRNGKFYRVGKIEIL